MKSKLIPYAMDFASFLMQKFKNREYIKNVILFGSVAREEEGKESDVDIFVDVVKDNKLIENEIKKYLEDFLLSARFNNYWKPLGVDNEINLTVGQLDKWKELKNSIISNGIVLYGKFKTDLKGKYKTLFVWENVKPNSRRVLFNKQMFGYKQGKKFYNGLIQKFNSERLGKGCIIIPLEFTNVFTKLFRNYKVNVKVKKIVECSAY